MAKFILLSCVALLLVSFEAQANCEKWAKLGALEWSKEILEADIEAGSSNKEPFDLKFGSPVLREKSKNPAGVAEVVSIDWSLVADGKSRSYSQAYFFDSQCHRMKSAEISVGRKIEH